MDSARARVCSRIVRREARSAARLSHPGIVTVIDRGEQDGHQFIVFEHVPGETLKQLASALRA